MNTTIIIQGNIDYACVISTINSANNIPIVISTWPWCDTSPYAYMPGIDTIINNPPNDPGIYNYMMHLISTIEGCKRVKTKYVIKVRGDEFYNYNKLIKFIEDNEELIYVAPIFFRNFSYCPYPYHISDHLIAGKTDYILNMFESAKKRYELTMSHDDCKEWGLTMAHLRNMGFEDFSNLELGKKEMKKRFNIIKMENLMPYRVTANLYNSIWYNNFIPHHHASIENIEDL